MSCEHHCEPGSVVKKIKKLPHYQPGAHSDHAYAAGIRQEQEKRFVDNQQRFKETEKTAKDIVNKLPPGIRYPVCERDNKSNEIKNYEIYITEKTDTKVAYTSNPSQKPKWVSFTNFCIFTHIFKRDEDGFSVPDPEKMAQFLPQSTNSSTRIKMEHLLSESQNINIDNNLPKAA